MFHLFPEYEIGQPITIRKWRIKKCDGVILSITSVPYHLSQAATTVKCTDSDSHHGVAYRHRFQASATGKSIAPDSRHGVGYGYLSQAAASGKCPFPDSRHGVRYGDLYQTPVTVKCTVRNTCHRIIFSVIQHRIGNNDLASGIVSIIRYPGLTSVKVIIDTIDLKSFLRFYPR